MSRQRQNFSAPQKASNRKLDAEYIAARAKYVASTGYQKPKWILFCETMMALGFKLSLYEARQTFSKYITITKTGDSRQYKVRFSNHRPIKHREEAGDCDFFVGIANLKTTTTAQAIEAVKAFFNVSQGSNS